MPALVLHQGARARSWRRAPLLVLACAACGSAPEDELGPEADGWVAIAASDVPPLEAGMLAQSAREEQSVQMLLLSSDPEPPSKGYNTFHVRLTDTTGAPYTPGSVHVAPWMPEHRHGTSVRPTLRADAASGEWWIEDLSLFMGSYWKVYVFVCDAAEARCCDAAAEPCAETSPSLRDTLFFETWIHD